MATIYPKHPPQSILENPKYSAEMKMFRQLQTLPQKFEVFYSVNWQDSSERYGYFEGEADFIIVHPDMGIIVLEVKGGAIQYKGDLGKWFSQDRHGEIHEIKDPMEQAQRNQYRIGKMLQELPNWPQREINIWRAVCFPDISLPGTQSLKSDLPRELILDANDLVDITNSITRIFQSSFQDKVQDRAPGHDRMPIIRNFLANTFEIRTPLGIELEKEDERLISLTEQQYQTLSILSQFKRVAIAGCAGSGKTMLAIQKARQFAELEMNVLLVCFNTALADDLKDRIPNVSVFHFHDLCKIAANEAGISIRSAKNEEQLFQEIYPEALMDASESLGRIYDAIIVDEGQDFLDNYWIALDSILNTDGYLYIFYDNNQNLYNGSHDFCGLITAPHVVLNINCRNTKAIHNTVSQFHNNAQQLISNGPEGRKPEIFTYANQRDLLQQLQKIVYKLINEEEIDNEDIVILTPHGEKYTALKSGTKLGNFILVEHIPTHQSTIQATSIYKFKGLERKVVILAEIDQNTKVNHDMVMYVGCSRARTHLIILKSEETPHSIMERVEQPIYVTGKTMKYKDLIQFEPVTEVIQLTSASQKNKAIQLVDTYVISDRMADVIQHRILPALTLGENSASRGLFIVGNYGTGKSHLMSVITAVAEHADLLSHVNNESIKEAMQEIAGKFIVIRQETGATEMHLRDVVFSDLERQLNHLGVDFHFESMDKTASNKQELIRMMEKFNQVFPGKGLLIALDELLDYIRARTEKQIIMDLNFLREIGEASEVLPIRFMTGIQEALFDNPRFQFVGDSIKRVKSRFDQALIVREDISYVVSHRLLSKTEQQKKLIRKHLEKFTSLYSEMAERLDQYVELFPVHPAYVEVFEQVRVGERRDLLTSLSKEMTKIQENDVPQDQPGLITYDSYWRLMNEDPSLRTLPDIKEVLIRAQVLSEKVRHAPDTRDFRDAALKIIDGLAINRLTVSDIYTPIGITPGEIRDQLCLYMPLPEQDADFLLATIETILKSISKAVNGQFISHNRDNDQYYLDLKKDIDYEALILEKAGSLDESTIDRYYYEILIHGLELNNISSYVPGFRIWESELPWINHGITRRGYVFLGAANERSTAHPERDYYIHFHGIYGNGHNDLTHQFDEVYFDLALKDQPFIDNLKIYAGSSEMSAISSGSNKDQYDSKIRQTRILLLQWLTENFVRCFKMEYQGNSMPITEAVSTFHVSMHNKAFRDQVNALSSTALGNTFEKKYPDYPIFQGIELTTVSFPTAIDSALRALSGGLNNRLAQCVLEGLQLGRFENGKMNWTIESGPYANHFLSLVDQLESGKVINRKDLFQGEPGAEQDVTYKLEPELVIILLTALAKTGSITLNLQGMQITENEINNNRLELDTLLRFSSISKPKALPEHAIRELFTQYAIDPDIAKDAQSLSLGLPQFQQKIQSELDIIVRILDSLRTGPMFWQETILSKDTQQQYKETLEEYRKFLSGLQNLTSISRLSNFSLDVLEIRAAVKAREIKEDIENIFDILQDIRPEVDYFLQAHTVLSKDEVWQNELKEAKNYILSTLADKNTRSKSNCSNQLRARLENIKTSYITHYVTFHQKQRLDHGQDAQKQKITSDKRWAILRALSKLTLLPSKQLFDLQDRLGAVESCPNLQPAELKNHPYCPHCGLNPTSISPDTPSAAERLELIQTDFDELFTTWQDVLVANLDTDEAKHNITVIDAKEREAVQTFLRSRKIPEDLTETFLNGVENTLQGLEIITIDGADYLLALTRAGMPCTADELEKRIRVFLQGHLEGKDRRKLRIQINW